MVKQVLVILILVSLFSCTKPVELTQIVSDENVSISPYIHNADSVVLNVPIGIHIAFHGNKIQYFSLKSFFNYHIEIMPDESYILDKKTKKIYYDLSVTKDYEARSDEDLIFYKRNFPISNTEAKALLVHTKYKDLDIRTLKDTLMLKPMKQLRADCPNCFSRIDTIDYKIRFKYNREGGHKIEVPRVNVDWKL